jgi:hypothetical protein
VKAPYLIARGRSPLPSLGGSFFRPRPVIAVRVSGPGHTPLRYSLLGHAGFLQFFDAEFRGADQEVVLTPNSSFPGQRV